MNGFNRQDFTRLAVIRNLRFFRNIKGCAYMSKNIILLSFLILIFDSNSLGILLESIQISVVKNIYISEIFRNDLVIE